MVILKRKRLVSVERSLNTDDQVESLADITNDDRPKKSKLMILSDTDYLDTMNLCHGRMNEAMNPGFPSSADSSGSNSSNETGDLAGLNLRSSYRDLTWMSKLRTHYRTVLNKVPLW